MKYVTERQRDILNFIREHQEQTGVAPTHREIRERFGFSSYGTVYKHLSLLESKGLIRRDWNQKRGVEIVEPPQSESAAPSAESDVRELPFYGYIAAGRPLDVSPSNETVSVPAALIGRGENYVLKVRGDSMIDDGIHDGDFVIVSHRESAENGQMVVALVQGEVTLKRFYADGNRVRLQPANPAVQPIFAPRADVAVQGIVVGLMRRF